MQQVSVSRRSAWLAIGLAVFWLPCLIEGKQLNVEVSAKAAILINADTGDPLFEKNTHLPCYPASITKVATALYALEKRSSFLDEVVTAPLDAISTVSPAVRRQSGKHPPYRLEFGGTHIGIKAGEELSLRVLLYGLMLPSGNDAANVISHHVSGSIPKFMEEMNSFIRAKGCNETVFYTPHGLPHPDHKTTAHDMAIIAKEALKYQFFREVVGAVRYTRPETNKQPESFMLQHNALLRPGAFYYPKAIGIKTGYTQSGGYTMVAAAKHRDRTLIAVLLGCEKIDQRYRDAVALFEAAFAEPKVSRKLFARGFDNFSLAVKGGKSILEASLSEDLTLEYYPSEESQFSASIRWQLPCLPIAPGQRVGEIQVVSAKGELLKKAPLFAIYSVESTFSHRCGIFFDKIKIALSGHVALILAVLGAVVIVACFYFFHYPHQKRQRGKKSISRAKRGTKL